MYVYITLRRHFIISFWKMLRFCILYDTKHDVTHVVYFPFNYSNLNPIVNIQILFFFSKKTPSISYKNLQMRLLCSNPCRDAIVPSYVHTYCFMPCESPNVPWYMTNPSNIWIIEINYGAHFFQEVCHPSNNKYVRLTLQPMCPIVG